MDFKSKYVNKGVSPKVKVTLKKRIRHKIKTGSPDDTNIKKINKMLKKLKQLFKPFVNTPLHPQWLNNDQKKLINLITNRYCGQTVLDIGCFHKWPKSFLASTCTYIGLDYLETAQYWYNSYPDVYGDAVQLPIQDECVDIVFLFDVLEHIDGTDQLLIEIHRVLNRSGIVLIQTPFLYPLHDEPRDFVRLTKYGFKNLAQKHGYQIIELYTKGSPIETATLLYNIAMTKTTLNWLAKRHPAFILGISLPFFIFILNILAKAISLLAPTDSFMPISYQVVFQKLDQ